MSGPRLLLGELRPERARIVGLVALLVATMLLPVGGQLFLGRFVDEGVDGAAPGQLVALGGGFGVTLLLAGALQMVVTWLAVRLAWRVGNRLRADLCAHALDLDLAWHGEHSPGLLIERVDGDVNALGEFASTAILHLLGNVILLAGVLVVATAIDWRTGLLLGLTTAAAVGVMIRLRSLGVPAYDHEREVQADLYGDLEERLGGLEDLRANGAGPWAVHRLHRHSSRWWHASRRAAVLGDGAYGVTGITFGLGTVVTLAAAVALYRQGAVSIGSVVVLFRFSQMLREPLDRIAEQLSQMQKAVAGARRAARLLGTRSSLPAGRGARLPDGPLGVELDGVALAYSSGRSALAGIDLRLAPGTVLGVVGRTGSGKTSLGRLLLRLWDPTAGTVRVGGTDLRELDEDHLRRRVAVVAQEVDVFRASVRDNLTVLGTVPATDAALVSALVDVGLGDWFADLAHGLDQVIDGTAELSAGEAQLLAFARVLLVDPGLVVLDEASSRLDPDTERRLAAATTRLRQGRTVVIIAHRLSTLDAVDEVCVVDGGRIIEHGDRRRLAADPDSRFGHLLAAAHDAAHGGPTHNAAGRDRAERDGAIR